ncbi:hypothetical protein GQ600_4184 [Phytophthora cactorum]|nr:hypothetical protein GQ600_4184 [Phytophthora cactorum]
MQFRAGALYEFKHEHGVELYADVPKGSVQLEDGDRDRDVQTPSPPILKRKGERDVGGRKVRARFSAQRQR